MPSTRSRSLPSIVPSVLFSVLFPLLLAPAGCSDDAPSNAPDAGTTQELCGPGTVQCSDRCVDTTVDPNNCGTCGHPCLGGQVCSLGTCAVTCPPSFVACNGGCIDPLTNRSFCGASGDCAGANAGQSCAAGEICVAGACRLNDASLASLTFSSGTLSPAFSPDQTIYILSGASLLDLYVTATTASAGATLTINGAPLTSGAPSKRIVRAANDTTPVTIEVTSPGGGTRNYGIIVMGTESVYAKASNTGAGDNFGWAVALDGDTLAVAAPGEDSSATGIGGSQSSNSASNSGAVYVFTRSGSTWSQQAYIKASNTGSSDSFGQSLALSGDTLVVGAPLEDSNATGVNNDQANNSASDSGAVYVFTRSGSTWSQQAYIKASNTGAGDNFGFSVAVSGDTLAVGAPLEDSNATGVDNGQTNNDASNSGAVYVFTRSGTTWSQQAYIKASNTGVEDRFGSSVALSGDTLVVGAPREDSNATGVGNDQTNDDASDSGAVYVFTRSGTTWSQQAYIKASNTGKDDLFGTSVALSGDTLAVGAVGEDSNAVGIDGDQTSDSASSSGAVYVFTRSGSTWSQQAYVKASNTRANDIFGQSVALSGDTLVVGAAGEPSNATGINGNQSNGAAERAGAVYVFARDGNVWSQHAYVKAPNTGSDDAFGSSVALSGDTLAVGAVREDSNATGIGGSQTNNSSGDSGAVYIF